MSLYQSTGRQFGNMSHGDVVCQEPDCIYKAQKDQIAKVGVLWCPSSNAAARVPSHESSFMKNHKATHKLFVELKGSAIYRLTNYL